MTDLQKAIAAAREALSAYRANGTRHYIDEAMEYLLDALDAEAPPAAAADGWRVMWFTGTFKCDSERWEIYDPEGNGGAVEESHVYNETVRLLLDALAAKGNES